MEQSKIRIVGLVILFLCFIAFPLFNEGLGIVTDTKSLENRAMAKEPVFDIEHLDPFPEKYEVYYNDHFSIRSRLVKYYNDFNLSVFKKSPFPDVIVIGYNHWLYMAGNEMSTYLGKNRLTLQELETWRLDLESQKKYLEKHGCKFYFMISPSKANIHSENIPYTYYQLNNQSWGEQLFDYLKKNSDVNVISVFEKFRELKEDNQLYYKQDNHWNRKGAFYAANIACTAIQKDFPNLMPISISDYNVTEVPRKGGDLAKIIGNPSSYTDTDFEFVSKTTQKAIPVDDIRYEMHDTLMHPQVRLKDNKNHKKTRLMMISDSYSIPLFPFITESFERSINVFDCWHYYLYPDIVEYEKPDVYILMIFEPWIKSMPQNRVRLKELQ